MARDKEFGFFTDRSFAVATNRSFAFESVLSIVLKAESNSKNRTLVAAKEFGFFADRSFAATSVRSLEPDSGFVDRSFRVAL